MICLLFVCYKPFWRYIASCSLGEENLVRRKPGKPGERNYAQSPTSEQMQCAINVLLLKQKIGRGLRARRSAQVLVSSCLPKQYSK